jgi:hypothetical protein
MTKTFLILITALLFSCQHTTKQQPTSPATKDSLPATKGTSQEEEELRRKEFEEQDRIDSVRQSQALQQALAYADRHKKRNSFKHDIVIPPDDSSYNISVQLIFLAERI